MSLFLPIIFKKKFYNVQFLSSVQNVLQNNDIENRKTTGNILSMDDIPTPRRLPLFGTTLDLLASGSAPKLHAYIDRRHRELGPLFREQIGTTDAVFVSSPHLMRSVFLYEGQYPTHPLPEAWIIYNQKFSCRRGLFFMDGDEWLNNRKIMNKFLLNGRISWINELIDKVTEDMIQHWKILYSEHKDGFFEIPKLEEQLYRWSIDIIIAIMFGKLGRNLSSEFQETVRIFSMNVHKIFKTSSELGTMPVRIIERFNMKHWRQFEESVTKTLNLGNLIVDIGLQEIDRNNGLLGLMQNSNICIEDIRRIFVDFIIAAGDTTAFATQWALYLLSCDTDVQKCARNEINTSHDSELPYIRGILRETLRLYPVAPFIGRFLASKAIIGNYRIDKGTLVLLSLYTSGRSEESFPRPLEFIPNRWIRNSHGKLDLVLHAHGSLPFAIGGRSCIGRKVALAQMQSLIIQALNNFELKCLNEKPVDIILRLVAVPDNEIKLGIKTTQ